MAGSLTMLLRHTLLYMPAQIIGPLFQLVAMIVWTHMVSDHTLGIITLVTATHELLQVGFLAWWSQYALRFFGRFQDDADAQRFYRTENAILLAAMLGQSLAAAGILVMVIAPDARPLLLAATVAYVITRSLNLYIGERARVRQQIGVYSIQQTVGPALGFILGLIAIEWLGQAPEWPLAGYAVAQLLAVLVVLPKIGHGRRPWPLDRDIVRHALHYGVPLVIGGGLGWIGLNASRFIVNDMLGVAAAGLFAVGYGLGQRAATVAAMLVTAAAFPIAVKRMEDSGSAAAMRQLSDNSALLIAILAPSVVGIFMLRAEIVHLLIAAPFRQVTLAVLPLSVLAGAIRNLRAHFGDQVFLLHNRTRLLIVVAGIDAVLTVALSFVCIRHWGIVGGAVATVIAAGAAAAASFAIGVSRFGLTLPLGHLARIALATTAMGAALLIMTPAMGAAMLAAHIATGAAVYLAALALLYMPSIWKMLRARPRVAATVAVRDT
jgi:O-antigen/teichoic acid export membrane protein